MEPVRFFLTFSRRIARISATEREDLMQAYHARLTSDDPEIQLAAARQWSAGNGDLSPPPGF